MPLNVTEPSRLWYAKLSGSEADLTLISGTTSVPTGKRYVCTHITVTNNDTVDRYVLLRFVASGDTAGDQHNILSGQTVTLIKAGATAVFAGNWCLHAGDKVRGLGSAADKVTVRGDGIVLDI